MNVKPDCNCCEYLESLVLDFKHNCKITWCSCKSSPNYGQDLCMLCPCDFFIPDFLYNYLVEEAIACNSSEDML